MSFLGHWTSRQRWMLHAGKFSSILPHVPVSSWPQIYSMYSSSCSWIILVRSCNSYHVNYFLLEQEITACLSAWAILRPTLGYLPGDKKGVAGVVVGKDRDVFWDIFLMWVLQSFHAKRGCFPLARGEELLLLIWKIQINLGVKILSFMHPNVSFQVFESCSFPTRVLTLLQETCWHYIQLPLQFCHPQLGPIWFSALS